MIATKETFPVNGVVDPGSAITDRGYNLPNSQRVYVEGEIHPDIRVPLREISLAPTKDFNGQLEPNEPVRVYDTSGPWGDPNQSPDSTKGLPPVRAEWIARRGDVAEYEGRSVEPRDDGYLTDGHRESDWARRNPPVT